MAQLSAAFNTPSYDPSWPFAPGIRCVVRVSRHRRDDEAIILDHHHKVFMTSDRRCFGVTPYELLRNMSNNDRIRQTVISENWGRLYFTADDGHTWVSGRELRRYHAAQHGRELIVGRRRLLPPAV